MNQKSKICNHSKPYIIKRFPSLFWWREFFLVFKKMKGKKREKFGACQAGIEPDNLAGVTDFAIPPLR